jgi:toxin ParE1/3/4
VKLVWLARAIATRKAQIDYIAQDNPIAALEQGDRIDEQVEVLKQHPELGRAGRVKGTRELVISRTPFIAVYRVRKSRIEILRVLHGAQQWPRGNPAPVSRRRRSAAAPAPRR